MDSLNNPGQPVLQEGLINRRRHHRTRLISVVITQHHQVCPGAHGPADQMDGKLIDDLKHLMRQARVFKKVHQQVIQAQQVCRPHKFSPLAPDDGFIPLETAVHIPASHPAGEEPADRVGCIFERLQGS